MLNREILKSGISIPVIGLGTYRSFDVHLNLESRGRLQEVLRLFFEAGGTVIDSSPMYGRAETVVGELLAETSSHDNAFIATKVWTNGRLRGVNAMKSSLRKLKSSKIELMQVHNLLDYQTHIKTLQSWKEDGRIQYLGITHYTASAHNELASIIKQYPIDFVQFPYSIIDRAAENVLLPVAAEYGVATLVNRPLEQSGLFRKSQGRQLPPWAVEQSIETWSQFFLKFILSHPAITCVIPATGDPLHMKDNLKAGSGILPDNSRREKMAAYIAEL